MKDLDLPLQKLEEIDDRIGAKGADGRKEDCLQQPEHHLYKYSKSQMKSNQVDILGSPILRSPTSIMAQGEAS